jgi:hypothetical protein
MQDKKAFHFDDASSLEWIDRETLRYSENGHEVSIWVDYESGLFKRGRVVKASSIVRWDSKPPEEPASISPEIRENILSRVEQYYKSLGVACRIEN